jgi:hypothetical protein
LFTFDNYHWAPLEQHEHTLTAALGKLAEAVCTPPSTASLKPFFQEPDSVIGQRALIDMRVSLGDRLYVLNKDDGAKHLSAFTRVIAKGECT